MFEKITYLTKASSEMTVCSGSQRGEELSLFFFFCFWGGRGWGIREALGRWGGRGGEWEGGPVVHERRCPENSSCSAPRQDPPDCFLQKGAQLPEQTRRGGSESPPPAHLQTGLLFLCSVSMPKRPPRAVLTALKRRDGHRLCKPHWKWEFFSGGCIVNEGWPPPETAKSLSHGAGEVGGAGPTVCSIHQGGFMDPFVKHFWQKRGAVWRPKRGVAKKCHPFSLSCVFAF